MKFREQKSKEWEDRNPQQFIGIDFARFPASLVNYDKEDTYSGDRFYPKENTNWLEENYSVIIYWEEGDGEPYFNLMTNYGNHYYSKEDLRKEFINIRKEIDGE